MWDVDRSRWGKFTSDSKYVTEVKREHFGGIRRGTVSREKSRGASTEPLGVYLPLMLFEKLLQ